MPNPALDIGPDADGDSGTTPSPPRASAEEGECSADEEGGLSRLPESEVVPQVPVPVIPEHMFVIPREVRYRV